LVTYLSGITLAVIMATGHSSAGASAPGSADLLSKSARIFVEEVARAAVEKVGKKRKAPVDRGNYPLAPIYIGVDKEGYNDVREVGKYLLVSYNSCLLSASIKPD
jgi:hypothetical protein